MRRSLAVAGLLALLCLPAGAAGDPVQEGEAAWARGDLPAALTAWSVALHAAREAGEEAATVDLGLRVAAALRQLGRLEQAETVLRGLEAPAAAVGGPAPDRVALARAQVLLSQGRAAPAAQAMAQLFKAAQAAERPVDAANIAVNLGLARRAEGDLPGAARALAGAASLFAALEDAAGEATARTDLSQVQLREGALAEAQQSAEAAVAAARRARRPELEADAQAALARVHLALGEPEAAEPLLEAALATARGRREARRQASLLMDLGRLDLAAGRGAQAVARFGAAEDVYWVEQDAAAALQCAQARALATGDGAFLEEILQRARSTRDRQLQAQLLLNIAEQRRAAGDGEGALRAASEAVKLGQRLGLSELTWRGRATRGLVHWQAGRLEAASEELEAAVAELEATRHGLSAESARSFLLGHEAVYEALVDVRLLQGDATGAFVIAQQLQLAELPAPPVSAAEEDPALAAFRRLQARESWLQQALAEEARGQEEGGERAEALKAELAELRVRFAATVDALRAAHPDFDALVRVEPEDLEAVQADLDPGVLVVQPVALPDRLVLLTARREGLGVHEVAVPRARLDAAVEELGLMMAFPRMFSKEDVEAAADALGAWLLAPLAEELGETDVVVLCPSGSLRALPLALLRHGGQPLVATHAVVRVTHVGSLRRHGAAEAPLRLDGGGLLLVGNPDGSLPGAEEEVRAIGDRLPGSTALIGSAATRGALVAHLEGKRALHLATHGVLDMRQPDRSHLVLAPGEGSDGRLGYPEIPGLAPWLGDVRLVVLSACESARPVDKPKGGEGEPVVSIQGLSAQFRRAGVETLVATLWKVDDRATQRLMGRFYDELAAGTDPARALQRAQQELAADAELGHPFFWGAFVVAGDWR